MAQIDNPTGESWDNVELSLLSGTPVSFVMNLYEPLYTTRTTLRVPGGQTAAPRRHEATVAEAMPAQTPLDTPFGPVAGAGRGTGVASGLLGGVLRAQESAPPPMRAATFQEASTAQIQDLFEYKFPFPIVSLAGKAPCCRS